jgi:hypothetical protein
MSSGLVEAQVALPHLHNQVALPQLHERTRAKADWHINADAPPPADSTHVSLAARRRNRGVPRPKLRRRPAAMAES